MDGWYIELLENNMEFISEKILETQENDIETINYLYGQRDMIQSIIKDLQGI